VAEVVAGQTPKPGVPAPMGGAVSLRYGPAPAVPPGATNLAHEILIPISHAGSYRWTSSPMSLHQSARSFVSAYRFIGGVSAGGNGVEVRPIWSTDGVRVVVTFSVDRYKRPAWLCIFSVQAQ
jgi:hypothetical protein